ncbi:rhodanese-like domain-containing protein [Anaerolineales bacterium HSG6]|nr:rhodanese-like domain-containing protein [Anaerolineales bacterium HSG6]MDM8531453.1 rhodanese-like domain-containing protein [Anaerolineales bacterium HSG25]
MQKLTTMMMICLTVLLLAACGQAEPTQAPPKQVEAESAAPDKADAEAISLEALPRDLKADQLEAIRNRDDVIILDVREDWEYTNGHIPGSTLIPLGELPGRISELPTDKTIVIVCHSGARSHNAVGFLQQQGVSDIHNMLGGIVAWERAGYEVE